MNYTYKSNVCDLSGLFFGEHDADRLKAGWYLVPETLFRRGGRGEIRCCVAAMSSTFEWTILVASRVCRLVAKGKVYRPNAHKPERWEDWTDQVDAIYYHLDREPCLASWFDWMGILRPILAVYVHDLDRRRLILSTWSSRARSSGIFAIWLSWTRTRLRWRFGYESSSLHSAHLGILHWSGEIDLHVAEDNGSINHQDASLPYSPLLDVRRSTTPPALQWDQRYRDIERDWDTSWWLGNLHGMIWTWSLVSMMWSG